MNVKTNFITGLGLGVIISVSAFLFIAAKANPTPEIQNLNDVKAVDDYKGGFISTEEATPLIAAFTTNFIEANNLPSNTTIGGFIGKENLKQVTATMNEEQYIRFSFYLEPDAAGNPRIGLVLFPDENATSVYRTGPSSFCPTLCSPPN